ncbi:YihY/virulence factor BrkB family protein [Streptomyces sp. NPDC004542]|uniref:YihY/virulence factor BrkB family protein n=1 Tax=Streptomyces sp. NPDC004542 TaxID=3154281 RepID=UPI0033AC7F1D
MSADPYTGDALRPRPPAAWWPALRRTPVSLWNDDISDYAAALTYYAILAVLPAMLVAVLAFGLISPGTAEEFVSHVTAYAPAESAADLHAVLSRMLGADEGAWPLLVAGTASALWSASSYLAVFRRALHRMHRVEDRRSPWRKAPRIVLTALVLLVLLLTGSLALLLTGPLAQAAGRALGLGATVAWGWDALRLPLLLCLVALLVVVVFHTGPVPARRRSRSLPGGVLAAVLWLTVSTGFALYTSHLSAYSRLYGSLAGVVVFLIWLWLSNLALLAGAQFGAELGKGTKYGKDGMDGKGAKDGMGGTDGRHDTAGHSTGTGPVR